jgi:hypothetical protein
MGGSYVNLEGGGDDSLPFFGGVVGCVGAWARCGVVCLSWLGVLTVLSTSVLLCVYGVCSTGGVSWLLRLRVILAVGVPLVMWFGSERGMDRQKESVKLGNLDNVGRMLVHPLTPCTVSL